MQVPFFDLSQQYDTLSADISRAMRQVFGASAYSGGIEVERFEALFGAYCGVTHCIGVDSGTSALHMALLASGVGSGDEVITTPLTFVGTVAAIEYCGAIPVFADCDPNTLALDPAQVARRITSKTKAIIPVHLHGHLSDIDAIAELARHSHLTIIEDAAQAHGAVRGGLRAGSMGKLGCFSFYPSKNLGAYGEGGAIVTDDPVLAGHLRLLRNWGSDDNGLHVIKGFNKRLHGLQAAILAVKLERLDVWNAARRRLAGAYRAGLSGLEIILPTEDAPGSHVYHVYAIRTPRRDALRHWLSDRGIGTHIHYPVPVHIQPAYRRPEYPPGTFPNSERAANELLSLPMFPEMRTEQVERVCEEIRRFFQARI